MKVLWCDDDSFGMLQPLGRLLEKKGNLSVHPVTCYTAALSEIQKAAAENTCYQSLLLDIILPYSEAAGALPSDLGITLAEHAAPLGVKAIAFLTVVRQDEVIDKYVELQRRFPQIKFFYFDKTELLSHGEIEELIDKLKAGYNHDGEHSDGT